MFEILVPGLSLARHTTWQVSRLPGIHAGYEPRLSKPKFSGMTLPFMPFISVRDLSTFCRTALFFAHNRVSIFRGFTLTKSLTEKPGTFVTSSAK